MNYIEVRMEKEFWEELVDMLSVDGPLFSSFYRAIEVDDDKDREGDLCVLLGWGDECPHFKKFLGIAKGFPEVIPFLFNHGYDHHDFQVSHEDMKNKGYNNPVWEQSSFGKYGI